MTDRSNLYKGLSCAAWGYLFLNLDFNFGNVSILPRFVGWLLFLSAIETFQEERRDLALLRPLAVLLALWTGADWLASWAGKDVDGLFPPLDLVITAAQIYFHFQFLTDMAALARTYLPHPEEERLSRAILRCRTGQVLLVTLLSFTAYLPRRSSNTAAGIVLVPAAAYCILGIWLMISLFSLRSAFKDAAPPPLPPASGGAGEI